MTNRPRSRSSPRLYVAQVKSKGSKKSERGSKKTKEKERKEKEQPMLTKSRAKDVSAFEKRKKIKMEKFASEGQVQKGQLMYSPRAARAASESSAPEIAGTKIIINWSFLLFVDLLEPAKSVHRTPPKGNDPLTPGIRHQSRHVHVNKLKKVRIFKFNDKFSYFRC